MIWMDSVCSVEIPHVFLAMRMGDVTVYRESTSLMAAYSWMCAYCLSRGSHEMTVAGREEICKSNKGWPRIVSHNNPVPALPSYYNFYLQSKLSSKGKADW